MSDIFFNGPAGRIEAKYTESTDSKGPIALVLHPHPAHGGTMNNKVVYSLYKVLAENNFTVMRINFRGVGRSLGRFDGGVGEMMDAAAAIDWLQLKHPLSQVHLIAGFSFGAWIAMQLIMRRPEITNFIAISPPVNKYDFSFLSPCPSPGLIVQGDRDSVVREEEVHELSQKLAKLKNIKVEYRMISGADHFFRDKIDKLEEEINDYLRNIFTNDSLPVADKANQSDKLKTSKKRFLE